MASDRHHKHPTKGSPKLNEDKEEDDEELVVTVAKKFILAKQLEFDLQLVDINSTANAINRIKAVLNVIANNFYEIPKTIKPGSSRIDLLEKILNKIERAKNRINEIIVKHIENTDTTVELEALLLRMYSLLRKISRLYRKDLTHSFCSKEKLAIVDKEVKALRDNLVRFNFSEIRAKEGDIGISVATFADREKIADLYLKVILAKSDFNDKKVQKRFVEEFNSADDNSVAAPAAQVTKPAKNA